MRRRWDVSRLFHGTYEVSPFRGLRFVFAFSWWGSGLPKKNFGKKSGHDRRGDGNASDICVIDLSAISGIQKCNENHERTFFGTALNAPAAKCKTSLVLVAYTLQKANNLPSRHDKSHSFGLHTTGGMWLDHKLSRGGKLRWWLRIKKGKKAEESQSNWSTEICFRSNPTSLAEIDIGICRVEVRHGNGMWLDNACDSIKQCTAASLDEW